MQNILQKIVLKCISRSYKKCLAVPKGTADPSLGTTALYGNIIVSVHRLNSVFVFNQQGELLHSLKDSISKPMGVCIDSKGRIIVVGYNQILLIF